MATSPERRRLLRYLRNGRAITRDLSEQPVRWTWVDACRNGLRFDVAAAEKLVAKGCVIGGVRHALRLVDGTIGTYELVPA